jgi:hypothetical protein
MIEIKGFTMVQLIINVILAITAVCGVVIGIINQIQIRRQTQRRLLVSMKQGVRQLPRIPDGYGGRAATSVHLFIIQAVNSGLTPVTLKDAGIILPDGKFLTKAFSPRHDKQFTLELPPGNDHEVHVDVYDVLNAIKGNGISEEVVVQGCFITPLKQYKSKKVHLNVEQLSNQVQHTEGAWRK